MEKFMHISAIGRPVDIRYPTNRAIVVLAALVVGGATIFQLAVGQPVGQSFVWGMVGGVAVFLAWALARDLDPDHDYSAFVAAGLTLVGYVFWGGPNLAALFWMLLVLRVINRSAGVPVRPFDSITVLGFGGWMAWQTHWLFGLLTAVAFLLDARLANPLKRHWIFGGLAFVVSMVALEFHNPVWGTALLTAAGLVLAVAATAIFVPVIWGSNYIKAVGDLSGEPLNSRRVQGAQLLALATVILFALASDLSGVVAWLPLWAAIIGAGIYRLGFASLERLQVSR